MDKTDKVYGAFLYLAPLLFWPAIIMLCSYLCESCCIHVVLRQERPKALTAAEKRGKGYRRQAPEEVKAVAAEDIAPGGTASGEDLSALLSRPLATALDGGEAAVAGGGLMEFQASPRFTGARPGFIFRLGPQGQGYYRDHGTKAAVARVAAEAAAKKAQQSLAPGGGGDAPGAAANAGAGWLPMRTVAQLRRDSGVGAPRNNDSLYRPVERAPRKFNPLKIPLALQVWPNGHDALYISWELH